MKSCSLCKENVRSFGFRKTLTTKMSLLTNSIKSLLSDPPSLHWYYKTQNCSRSVWLTDGSSRWERRGGKSSREEGEKEKEEEKVELEMEKNE